MRFRLHPLLAGLLLSALLAGCEDPPVWETDRAKEPICDRVLTCGAYGYADVEECQDALVGNPSLGTACEHPTRYFECLQDACEEGCRQLLAKDQCERCDYPGCNLCDHLDCPTFLDTEQACFALHCPPDAVAL